MPSAAAATRVALGDAIEIATREMQRLGLGETHRVAGIYAAPDVSAEGAEFAAMIFPRLGGASSSRLRESERLKLLIGCDGQVSICPFARRCARPCRAASRC